MVEAFLNPAYLKDYQDGFEKKELISGNQGEEKAVSKLYYKHGKHEMVMEETILSNQLPDFFEAEYHHKHMDNFMRCRFIEMSSDQTKYEYEFEYSRIDWLLPRLISILFPGMYKKSGDKWMTQFKELVETL